MNTATNPYKEIVNKPGLMVVRKVTAYHNYAGHTAYKLCGRGTDEIDVDPAQDPEIYRDMIAFCSDIEKLNKNSDVGKSLVLAQFWDVQYRWEERLTRYGKKQMKVAVSIKLNKMPAPDLPSWAANQDEFEAFLADCHVADSGWIDTLLGVPRTAWPDRQSCLDVVAKAQAESFAKAGLQPLAQVQGATPKVLDEWFPRDENGKPIEPPQERQPKNKWITVETSRKRFWARVHEVYSRYTVPVTIDEHKHAHQLLEVEHTDQFDGTEDQAIEQLDLKLAEIYKLKGLEIVQMDTPNQAPEAQQNAPKASSATTLPEAPFSANFKLIHKSGVEVQFTIRAESGAVGLPQVDKAIDHLLNNGYSATRAMGNNNAPAGATQQSASPAQSDRGQSPCIMVKVGKSFTGNKPQLEFEVDGFENPLRYTSDNPGKLAAMLNRIRKPDGSEFTANDLTDGRKFVGNWRIAWEKKQKDDKTYTNVLSIEPAA